MCSVSLGYDVVPRLGLLEITKLRLDILHALRNCNTPKVIQIFKYQLRTLRQDFTKNP